MPELKDVSRYDWDTDDYRLAHELLGDRADHKDVKLVREFRRRAEARIALEFQKWMDNLTQKPTFEEIVERFTKHQLHEVCPSCGSDDVEIAANGWLTANDSRSPARCHGCPWSGAAAELKTRIGPR